MKMYIQHLRADNDSNGNPQRLYLVYRKDGTIKNVIDEGYSGRPQIDAFELMMINITSKEYHDIKKQFKPILIQQS